MCAQRGRTWQNDDNYAYQQQHTQTSAYSDYGNHAHHYGAERSTEEGVEMSYGQQVQGQWFFNQPGYDVPGPWAIGYGQAPYANQHSNGGYDGSMYASGPQSYENSEWGYQSQLSGNYEQYIGGNSNHEQIASNRYGEIEKAEQEKHIDSGYSRISRRPESSSYSNYRRSQNHRFQQSRGYTSDARQRAGMPSDSTTTSNSPRTSSSPRHTPPPPRLPRQTKPTEEYLAITQNPSSHVEDPSSARKLVVLDLNGSLLLRSAHSRRNPYADPTKPRPLRTVHRRPYLGAFTSYILHDRTKDWLDSMIWSSAQPHSVEDMVDRCIGERKSELRAVWARDTLGLTADDYHKKTLTLKDLAKPWDELPYYSTTTPASEETETKDSGSQHHSALSTILVDDSPRKAMLQPWNHLVIREYLQQTRNIDLKVVEWEEAKQRMEKTQRDIETLERITAGAATGGDQAVHVDQVAPTVETEISLNESEQPHPSGNVPDITGGEGTSEQAAGGSEVPTVEGVFIPNARRKKKKLAQQAKVRQAREEKQRAAFAALHEQQHTALAERLELAQANGQVPADVELPKLDPEALYGARPKPDTSTPLRELKYDETLLAVVGVLDRLKHETNVSSWMRSGGLINTALAGLQPSTGETEAMNSSASPLHPSTKNRAPSRGASPSEHGSPAKKRRIESSPALETDMDTAPAESSSPIATEPPPSQISTNTGSSPPPSEEQAQTGVPLSAPVPTVTSETGTSSAPRHEIPSTTGAAGLWYEDEMVLKYWADQGRKALAELGIEADSGMRTVFR